jgi:GT2 family glycosyltransferase
MIPGLKRNLNNIEEKSEILVRDNGSSDDNSIEYLQSEGVRILKMDHNCDSFSEGVNSLFRLTGAKDSDKLLLLNNDIKFNDDVSLGKMLKLMEKTGSAVVGAKLLYEDGKISHLGTVMSASKANMPWHYKMGEKNDSNKNAYFQAVTAACCFVNAGSFIKAGMMDTKYFFCFEDVDLSLTISKQGGKIACCGETNITHLTSESLKKNPVNKMMLPQNVKYFKEKWFGKYKIDHDLYLKDPNHNLIKD